MTSFVDSCYLSFLPFSWQSASIFSVTTPDLSLYIQGAPGVSGASGLQGEVGDTVGSAPFFYYLLVQSGLSLLN